MLNLISKLKTGMDWIRPIFFQGNPVKLGGYAVTVTAGLPEFRLNLFEPKSDLFPSLSNTFIMSTVIERRLESESPNQYRAQNSDLSPLFSARKSAENYIDLKTSLPIAEARRIAIQTIAQDMISQTWEIVDTTKPYTYSYFIEHTQTGLKVVHESDQESGKDLLDAVNGYRRGRERIAAQNYRQAMIDANVGESIVWISPKKEKDEVDCYYPETFIQVARKISSGELIISQFKSRDLNTSQSVVLLNKLLGYEVINPEADLDDVIVAVGKISAKIEDRTVIDLLESITGKPQIDSKEAQAILNKSKLTAALKARKFLNAVDSGLQGEKLEHFYTKLLVQDMKEYILAKINNLPEANLVLQTNCGNLSLDSIFGRSGPLTLGIDSLISILTGEVKCRKSCGEINICRKKGENCWKCGAIL